MGRLVLLIIFVFGTVGCSFLSKRLESRERKEYEQNGDNKTSGTSDEQLSQIRIRDYEKRFKNQREKEHYSKLLQWFKNDDERLQYLSLNNMQDKQEWAQSKRIWSRAKNPSEEMKSLMQSQDIAIGMPMDYVLKAWGDPIAREASGNPLYKNEKWRYNRSISTSDGFKQEKRIVYFEGGKVVGWETD